jgi:hypothetical protein
MHHRSTETITKWNDILLHGSTTVAGGSLTIVYVTLTALSWTLVSLHP